MSIENLIRNTSRERIEKHKYYLQINKKNLQTYFSFGLIYPVNLEHRSEAKRNREKDIFSLFPDFLILGKGKIQGFNEDCLLFEIVITDEEDQQLIKYGEIFLFKKPLPISRIKFIYAPNKRIKDDIIASSETFTDTIIPEKLIKTKFPVSIVRKKALEIVDLQSAPNNLETKNFIKSKYIYDRLLGMLAFMKNTRRYYTNENCFYSDVSENYFKVLNLYNKKIYPPSDLQNSIELERFYKTIIFDEKYDDAESKSISIIRDKIFDGAIFDEITATDIKNQCFENERITEKRKDHINNVFKELFDKGYKDAIILINKLEHNLPYLILTILYKYHIKDGNDKFNLKDKWSSIIPYDSFTDGLLAILGLYYGYANLPKDENVSNLRTKYVELCGENHSVKYGLESKLDRIVLESIYQYAFNNIFSDSLFKEYLPDKPTPSKTIVSQKKEIYDKSYIITNKSFKMHDVQIKEFTSIAFKEYLIKILKSKRYPDKITQKHMISQLFVDIPELVDSFCFTKSKGIEFEFKKSNIIEFIERKDINKTPYFNKLMAIIEADNKYLKLQRTNK